jgi:hypothetical protein
MLGLAVLLLGAIASSAAAATLKISVPRHVRDGRGYTITINGSFKRDEVKDRAYLIAAIQFGRLPCQATAQQENNLAPQFYFGLAPRVGVYERRSPFTRSDTLKAEAPGPRHVCAYLYSELVGPMDATTPIATADVWYRVFRRP